MPDTPKCLICGGRYEPTPKHPDDGYNIHTGTERHRVAVAKAVGRSGTERRWRAAWEEPHDA